MATASRARRTGTTLAVALAAMVVAGCGDDDTTSSSVPAPAPPTAAAPGTSAPAAVDVPATPAPAPPTPTTQAGGPPSTSAVAPGGYEDVAGEQLLRLAADGMSDPISDPLADGVYFATGYSLTADGGAVRFDLARFISVETCIEQLGTVPVGTVDQLGCYGGVVDTSAIASITMPVDSPTPVILVSAEYRLLSVTAAEFGRLLAGAAPAPDAPPGYEYQSHWGAMVEVVGGRVVRANQMPSS